MTKVLWIPLLILFISLVRLPASGSVIVQLSDRGFSYIIDQAIKNIDSSIKTTITFRKLSLNAPKSDDFIPTGSLTYRISLNVRDLHFDSLDVFNEEPQVKAMLGTLNQLCQKLIAHSVQNLHAEVSVLVAVNQDLDDINIKAKFFPSRLKIYTDKKGRSENEVNTLLDFMKSLLLTRCEKFVLKGVVTKYFKTDLKLGEIATVSAMDLPETKTLHINYHLGKVNDLNPLTLEDIYTSNGSLHISGTSLGKGRSQ